MRRFIATLLLFNFSFRGFSQQATAIKNEGSNISGKIADSLSHQPIEYATISLTDDYLNKIVNGTISNKKGNFKIINVPAGKYTVTIESIGYSVFIKKEILVKNNADAINIQEVLLVKKVDTLQAVVVTGTKQIIENKIDKIVFNVDKDITSQGGMATDVLKKIPQVTVDINGNVELLGNPGIRFLIDGKPSGIFGNNPTDALQSIPSSQIQSIEVITNPSAKYDASGTGGIINIILKKNNIEGFNSNVNLSVGTRLENAGINTGFKKNNFSINAYFNGNQQLPSNTPIIMDRVSVNNGYGSSRFIQQGEPVFERNGYNTGIGLDWALSKKDNLSGSIGLNHFANENKGNYNEYSIQYDAAGNESSNNFAIRDANTKYSVNTIDNLISYKRKLKKEGQEIDIFYNGSYSQNNTDYLQSHHYKNTDTSFSGSSSQNPGKENLSEFGLNYSYPISKEILLETGLKTGMESIISNADVFTLNTATGEYVKDEHQSIQSDFHRTIYACYASLSFPLFKLFDVKAGLRYEHTKNDATYSNAPKTSIPAYDNPAPSLIVSHAFKNKQTLKFAYAYRLERPDFRDLNPFVNLSDPHNIITGNPNLQPEIGHLYTFTYTKTFDKGTNINLAYYWQKNSPDIKPFVMYYPVYKIGDSIYKDVTVTTRTNIAAEIRTGFNLSVSIPANNKFSVRSNTLIFIRHLENLNDTPSVTNGFGVRLNLNATYQFSKTVAAEIFGNYNSGMKWQGKQPSSFTYTMAVRKQFKNNKGSIGFIAVNPFNKYIDQKSIKQTNDFTTNIYQQLPYRSFGVSFTYKFGKLKFTKPKESDNYLYTAPVEN